MYVNFMQPGITPVTPKVIWQIGAVGSGPVGGVWGYANRPASSRVPTFAPFSGIGGSFDVSATSKIYSPVLSSPPPPTFAPFFQDNSWGDGIHRPPPSPFM